MNNPIKYIIFDFDGTLADTFDLAVSIYKKIQNEYNFPLITDEEFDDLKKYGAREIFKKYKIPFYKLPQIMLRAYKELDLMFDQIKPFDGILDMIKNLNTQGFKLGILSSNSQENIIKFLEKYKLQDYFEFVYTGKHLFSKDKKLKQIMRKHDIANDEIVYVGDEDRDIEAANKAQVKSIAVLWGFNHEHTLFAQKPTASAETPDEILTILNNLS